MFNRKTTFYKSSFLIDIVLFSYQYISINDTYLAIQIIENGEKKQIIMIVSDEYNSGRSTLHERIQTKDESSRKISIHNNKRKNIRK